MISHDINFYGCKFRTFLPKIPSSLRLGAHPPDAIEHCLFKTKHMMNMFLSDENENSKINNDGEVW